MVLERVVENEHIRIEPRDRAMPDYAAIAPDQDRDARRMGCEHQGLVARSFRLSAHGSPVRNDGDRVTRISPVPTTRDHNPPPGLGETPREGHRGRRLARTAEGQSAHAHDRTARPAADGTAPGSNHAIDPCAHRIQPAEDVYPGGGPARSFSRFPQHGARSPL